MAELQSVEAHQTNGGFIPLPIASTLVHEASIAVSAGVSVGSKRLRRPSVRLGEIGGGGGGEIYQHVAYDSDVRRPKWRSTGNRKELKSSSRTQTLTNLGSRYDNTGTLDEDTIGIGTWRGETTTKRVRSNWVTKIDESTDGNEKFSEEEEEEELEEGFRDFSREDSESPMKEENRNRRRRYEIEFSRRRGRREGVKIWLQELGLGRYWPMFEMHEVDEQVLPLLTLEDLKDIGINAVGSRRKMYSAIQKLGREF